MDSPAAVRLPVVGVLGSGTEAYEERAARLGRWLAGEGVHLLTGGGGGVMSAVAQAFQAARTRGGGIVIGIVPAAPDANGRSAPAGYPNRWVDVAVYTHLPLRGERGGDLASRNHINVLSSDVIIALPGGAGTASEVRLAVRYAVPVAAYVDDRTSIPGLSHAVPVVADFAEVRAFVRSHLVAPRASPR